MDAIGLYRELLNAVADRDRAEINAEHDKPEEFAGQADQESAYARGHRDALLWAAAITQTYLISDGS